MESYFKLICYRLNRFRPPRIAPFWYLRTVVPRLCQVCTIIWNVLIWSKVVGELDGNYYANCIECSFWSSQRSPILWPSYCVLPTALSGQGSCGLIITPWSPFEKGFRSSWRECFAIVSDVPRSLLHTLFFISPWQIRYQGAIFTSLISDLFM